MSKRPQERTNNPSAVLHVLRKRIVEAVMSGVLEHGDRLQSVREVSEELGAHPRVVLGAYQTLVEEGIVEVRSRSGVFATGAHSPTQSASTVPRRWMLEIMLGAIARDIPPLWLGERIRAALLEHRTRAAVIECNADQLESMSKELATYFELEVVSVPLDVADSPAGPRELANVDLIISAAHEDVISRIASTVQKPYVITSVRPALMRRLSRLLARGPFYFLVVDPRFAAKMRRLVAPMIRSENFHVLVVDRDDLRVIPAGAPTYVMRSALPRLDSNPHLGRQISPHRIFSEETSREILLRILELSSATDAFERSPTSAAIAEASADRD